MTRLRAWIRSFFGFSRTETNAFLILLPLMTILILSEPVYRYWLVQQPQDFSEEQRKLDSLIATWKWDEPDSVTKITSPEKLFQFNPNTASKEELSDLGFSNSLINRVIHYRLKGGTFKKKKDLMKIYGMDSAIYRKLFPFIDLPDKIIAEGNFTKVEPKDKPSSVKFDLNTADTSQLIKIYGIGVKLSRRIVLYRDKLGGFISLTQLKEVYGLDTVVVKELSRRSFIDEDFQPKLIDINKATEQQLGDHPYLKYKLAKAIIAYRFQHGSFQSVEEVKNIKVVDELTFKRIKPYLSVNP